jgi:nucleoside-diphosphate-sugar epimerase
MLLLTGSTGFIGGALAARLINTLPGALAVPGAFGQSRRGRTRLASNLRLHGVSEQDLARLSPDQIICGDLTGVERWIDDPRLLQVNDG